MGSSTWLLGLTLCIFSAVFGTAGKILIKLSHVLSSNQLFWYGLIFVILLNPSCSAISYHFATQSLLAPMAGFTIVLNTFLSPYLLQETLNYKDIIGAMFILFGCIIVGISSSHEIVQIPINQLASHLFTMQFIIYFLFFMFITITLSYYTWPALRYGDTPNKMTRVSFAALAGIITGQLYFLSGFMRMLGTENKETLWHHVITYIFLFGAIIVAAVGLWLLNKALKLYEAVFVIYIYEATLIITGAISSLCFFNDVSSLRSWHLILYCLSMFIMIMGVYLIAQTEDHGSQRRLHTEALSKIKQFASDIVSPTNANNQILFQYQTVPDDDTISKHTNLDKVTNKNDHY